MTLGQPDAGELAAADRCVILTGVGCWKVYDCDISDVMGAPLRAMCEFDIRESQPTKKELLTYIQVLRENVKMITKDCKTCKGVGHISMPKEQ